MRRCFNIVSLIAIIILSSCNREDDLIPVAKIAFKDAYTAEFTSVSLSCEVKSNVTIETLHVAYSTSKDMTDSKQVEMTMTKENNYSAAIPNLSIQTEYYYKFIVGNRVSEYFDDQKRTFKTLDYVAPVVITENVSNVSGTKATFKGYVEFACEKPILERGFMVGKDANTLKMHQVTGSEFLLNLDDLDYNTTYYYRAYAKNEIGTGLGEIKTFQTCGAVSFNDIKISSVTATSAIVEGGVSDNGGIQVDIQGIRYCIKGSNEISFIETTGKTSLNNLKHDTSYEVWCYAKTFEGEFEGNKLDFNTMDGNVQIITLLPTNITTSSATLKGNITSDGGSKITERGFCYSVKDIPTLSDTKIIVTGETGSFENDLTNLNQNIKYNVRAYAINGIDTFFGDVVSFTTFYDSATFETITLSNVTASSASLTCAITSNGGSAINECGFCYSTDNTPTLEDEIVYVSDSKSHLNATIQDLKSCVRYYVRAFATNANDTFYSEEISFIATDGVKLSDLTISSITADSAIAAASILSDGGLTIEECGVCYSTTTPTINDNKLTASLNTTFNAAISNLSPNTTYYLRAYAKNSAGVYYSNISNFKTQTGLPTLGTLAVTNIKQTSIDASSNILDNNGAEIEECGFCYSTSASPTISSNKHILNSFKNGVYSTITGLTLDTDYYIKAFAKTKFGVSYSNEIKVHTIYGLAVLGETIISNILPTAATIKSSLISDSGESILDMGFCYATHNSPKINDNVVKVNESFTLELDGLVENTQYYICSYATTQYGTTYGNIATFTTTYNPVVFSTSSTEVTPTIISVYTPIISDGGYEIYEQGVCYSLSKDPTENNYKVISMADNMDEKIYLTGLSPNTTYYIRAYVKNRIKTFYSDEIVVKTIDAPKSTIPGLFSVSSYRKVYFTKGNLISNTEYGPECYLAPNQYTAYKSGYGCEAFWGGDASIAPFDIHQFDILNKGISIKDVNESWRCLSSTEWKYLINSRANAESLRMKVTINDVDGLLLIPDIWYCPNNVSMPTSSSSISVSDWEILEQSGCVFLPYVGCVKNLWSTRGWWHKDECTSPTHYLTSETYNHYEKGNIPIIFNLNTFSSYYVGDKTENDVYEYHSIYAAIRLVVNY